jgi:hypothetical protein
MFQNLRLPLLGRSVARGLLAVAVAVAGCSTEPNDGEHDGGGAPNEPNGGTAPDAGAGGATTSGAGGVATSGGSAARGGSGGASSSKAGAAGAAATSGTSGSAGTNGNAGTSGNAGAGASAGASGGAGGPSVPNGALTVFYLDVGGRVMATDVADPEARVVVADAGQGPDGIAVDVERGHVYWTGMGVPANDDGFIRRSNFDGSNVVTIVPAGGTYTPKQLKLDGEHGKLYWSDREGMRVQRANLDGSALETLVTTGTGADDRRDNANWCVGIALDVAGGFFYWSQKGPDNGGAGSIRRAHLTLPQNENSTNRSDIEVLFSGLPEPIDIDLDLGSRRVYWTDRGDDTINRAPIEIPTGATAANRTDREILVRGVREAIGVTLDLTQQKLYFTGGTGGRVGMANLDGSGAVDLLTGSAGLTGIAVVRVL